ncbi:TetR/AcrR family transcriptional regulator [Planococcus sp. CPCC 101016]|uniref:TetR/AcrR family transcriptional regulator n=1 Tax=Planococcus sp. CPCC 101016 TaxID=2599617 RepID=UPI0011B81DFB|nr:TetR/AcrR family transcriptional regulator [Planococcus sp. CPCC 101016]TWT08031.1 TetR/AcrR family transcriptional regulator [Planococcus sp. CPCC 101016]
MITNRKQQAKETKQKLLDAARDVFFENGFQKSTISQINKKAETGHGTAYVYFKNKEDFLIELMKETMESFYQIATIPFRPVSQSEAHELISHQVKQFLSLALEKKQVMKIFKEAIGTSPIVESNWQNIRKQFIESITRDIIYAQKQLLANQNLNPFITARSWFYMNEMFMWELVGDQCTDDIEEIIKHMTILYTNGLYTEKSHK